MACILDSGYALSCKDNSGGVSECYIGNFSSDTTYALDSSNIITGVTSGATFYTFSQRNENAELNEEGNHSIENGSTFYVQNLNLIFHKNEAALRNTLLLLAKASLTVIVKTQNGDYQLLGKQNAVELIASTSATGKGYGDLNGGTVSLEGREPELAHFMTAAAFATLVVN